MALWFLLALIGLPIIEIAVFIEAGDRIGLWPTVGAILATAAIGLTLIRLQGMAVLRRAQENLAREQFPGLELFDGLCLFIAGALLITPGFITDTFGFLLLIVPLRRWLGRRVWGWAQGRGYTIETGGAEGEIVVINGEFADVTKDADTSGPGGPAKSLPEPTIESNGEPNSEPKR